MGDADDTRDTLEEGGTAYDGGAFRYLRMAVTAEAPRHIWQAGRGSENVGYDGFSVHTDGHIWIEARDTGARQTADGGGTLTVQSEGQAWLQSQEGPLALIAKDNIALGTSAGSKSGLAIAAKGSLKIVTDRSLEAKDADVNEPDAEQSESEEDAEEIVAGWETWWTTLDAATALALNAFDVAMATGLTGIPFPTPSLDAFIAPIGAGANFAAAGVGVGGMIAGGADADTPSALVLSGEAGIMIGSPIGVSIAGGPGALIGSAFTTVFAGVSTSVVAGLTAGVASAGPVDVTSMITTSISGGAGAELASRRGPVLVAGTVGLAMQAGGVEARALANVHVDSATWLDLAAPRGKVAFRSAGLTTVASGLELLMAVTPPAQPPVIGADALEDLEELAPIQNPMPPNPMMRPYARISILSGVEMGAANLDPTAPVLKITDQSVELTAGAAGAGPKLTVDAGTARLTLGTSIVEVGLTAATFDALNIKL